MRRSMRVKSEAARLLTAASLARAHALFSALLLAGLGLRVVALLAYRPAIINVDAEGYLENAVDLEPNPIRPIGYALFLRALAANDGLTQVAVVQHLVGLAVGVLVYVLLARLGVPRWLAASASAPVLLDAMQLNIEQSILSDSLFAALLVAGCAALLWQRPPGATACVLAGVLFAAAVLTRTAGLVVILPALVAAFAVGARTKRLAMLAAAFALPLAGYAGWFYGAHGMVALNGYGGYFLYGRVAPFADCGEFDPPPAERPLCPAGPPGERPTADQFVWLPERSPLYRTEVDPEGDRPVWAQRSDLASDFALRVIVHQPGAYAERVAGDFVRGFALTRSTRAGEVPAERWKFRTAYLPSERRERVIAENGGGEASLEPGLAAFLHGYQRFGYTPGPVLAVCLVLALAGIAFGRATRSAALTFLGVALVVLLIPAATALFSWRYQLPQLVLLPAAGALGLTALRHRLRVRRAPSEDGG
jgi:hypothetical protein